METFLVNGTPVDRKLLETRLSRRCLLEECQAHCCGSGVYIEVEQAKDILAHKELILPHLPPDRRDPEKWFDWIVEPDYDHPDGGMVTSTTVVEDRTHPTGHNCIFLRRDRKCALQVASIAAGERPWRFKPFYCALYPLVFDRHRLILDEDNEIYLEGGSCQRPCSGERIPIFRLFEKEVKLAIGEVGYAALEAQSNSAANSRGATASV